MKKATRHCTKESENELEVTRGRNSDPPAAGFQLSKDMGNIGSRVSLMIVTHLSLTSSPPLSLLGGVNDSAQETFLAPSSSGF